MSETTYPQYKLAHMGSSISISMRDWCIFKECTQLVQYLEHESKDQFEQQFDLHSSVGHVVKNSNYYGMAYELDMRFAQLLDRTLEWIENANAARNDPTIAALGHQFRDPTNHTVACCHVLDELLQLTSQYMREHHRYFLFTPTALRAQLWHQSAYPVPLHLYSMDQSAYYRLNSLYLQHRYIEAIQLALNQFCDWNESSPVNASATVRSLKPYLEKFAPRYSMVPLSIRSQHRHLVLERQVLWPSLAMMLNLPFYGLHIRCVEGDTVYMELRDDLPDKSSVEHHVFFPLASCLLDCKDVTHLVMQYWLVPCQWYRYWRPGCALRRGGLEKIVGKHKHNQFIQKNE